jgi:hypothetical protein
VRLAQDHVTNEFVALKMIKRDRLGADERLLLAEEVERGSERKAPLRLRLRVRVGWRAPERVSESKTDRQGV